VIRIPFNRPFATGDELDYIRAAIAAPKFSGDGSFTAQCHVLLEQSLGVQKALLTTSCTHALEMAALLLNIEPGDEVIVPSFTFPSAVNAFVLRGAKPVFVDIRADTLNIDESQIEQRITAQKSDFSCALRGCRMRNGHDHGYRAPAWHCCGRR
jgi:dTDP-4-amino-4,6-dideoxygalactose transaminase